MMSDNEVWPQHEFGCAVHADEDFNVVPTDATVAFVRSAAAFVRKLYPEGCQHSIGIYRDGEHDMSLSAALDFRSADQCSSILTFIFVEGNIGEIALPPLSVPEVHVPVRDIVDGIMIARLIVAELASPLCVQNTRIYIVTDDWHDTHMHGVGTR